MEKKSLKAKANDSSSPVDRDVYLSHRGFGSLKTKIFAPAPILQVESAVTIIPHSHFLIELLVFSKCVPSHYYLDPYIITAV